MTAGGDKGYTRSQSGPWPGPAGSTTAVGRRAGLDINMRYDVGLFAFTVRTEEAESGAAIEKPA